MSWSKRFDVPIEAGDEQLTSLRDAATFITRLPKAEQHRPHWHTAIEMLLKAAERDWPAMFAEIAVRRAFHHDKPHPAAPPRKKTAKKYRIFN